MVKVAHISDTHLNRNLARALHWVEADILIHSGDATDFGSAKEFGFLARAFKEFGGKKIIYVPGNHDLGLDEKFEAWPGEPPDVASSRVRSIRKIFADADDRVVVCSPGSVDVMGLRIDVSSASLTYGKWAFTAPRWDWSWLRTDTDIVVTHGPAHGLLDLTYDGTHAGDPALKAALHVVKPQVHMHGHIHEARGTLPPDETRPWVTSNAANPDLKGPISVFDIVPRQR